MEVLYYGSTGPTVQLLQTVLTEYGLYGGKIDGIYGPLTLQAVKQLQRQNNLPASGVVWPGTWDLLKFSLLEHDVFTGISYSSAVLGVNLRGLVWKHPYISLEQIGESYLGEPLYTVTIGKGNTPVFFNAAHHANEWITVPALMRFLQAYADAYESEGTVGGIDAVTLFDNCRLTVMPMVNPDGVDLVTGQISPDSAVYSRALQINSPPVAFPQGWKANIRGVDLNLNYPAGWQEAKWLKYQAGYTSPGPRDFVGAYPLSEKETQAVAYITQKRGFALTVSLHTQGREIYWTFNGMEPEGAGEIARRLSAVSGYALGEPEEFSSFAGYKDWFIYRYMCPGFTVECGSGSSPLPLSQLDEIYAACEPLLANAMLAVL